MSYYKYRKTKEKLLEGLDSLGAYVYHKSKYSSLYIKFGDPRIGSLRLADHDGRRKYRYKWNIGPNLTTKKEADRGVMRYYYHSDDVDEMIQHILNYQRTVQKNAKRELRAGVTLRADYSESEIEESLFYEQLDGAIY